QQIIGLQKSVINYPLPDELPGIGVGFEGLAESATFYRLVGSIDGCHIRIKPPCSDAQCYLNRKLFLSVQMQAVFDHKCNFFGHICWLPCSVHNARVLKNSPLYVHQLYPPESYCSGGWWISLYVPTHHPYNTLQGASEKSSCSWFNRHHAKARSVIEWTFGIMKTRWRAIFFKA
ncbi:hypothetical protein LDENG_00077650, partial [Lucifuga dentata]